MWKFAITTNNPTGLQYGIKYSRYNIVIGCVLCVIFSAVIPAQAQIFSDEETRANSNNNSENIEKLSTIINNLRKQLGAVSQKQQTLDQRLRDLSGQVQEIKAEKKQTEQQVANNLRKVDERLEQLKTDIADVGESIGLPNEVEMYNIAFNEYQQQNYDKAVSDFNLILKHYPDGKFNANARYWMSQIFLSQKKYEESANLARETIQLHSNSDKVPDSMLILARALKSLDMPEESKNILSDIVQQYPTTLAADKARQLLTAP